jgi:hypothetical protein
MEPSSQRHIQQWKHNRSFLPLIDPPYADWIVNVAFYVALHAVDALLAHDRVTGVNSHDARNDVLMRTNRYTQIQRHYMPLYQLSRTVRYLADPRQWVPANQVESQVIKRFLYPIEKSVQNLIGADLQLDPVVLKAAADGASGTAT